MSYNFVIVIVLYRMSASQSKAYQGLCSCFTPEQLDKILYLHDNTHNNIQLSGAYNAALQQAQQRHARWLVLFDQDTEVTTQYVDELIKFSENAEKYQVAVPILKDESGRTLSPFFYNEKYGPFAGISYKRKKNTDCLTAFNSGVVLDVALMQEIGGFSEKFPLDYLDYDYFHKFHKCGVQIKQLPITLTHTLSVNSSEKLSLERYNSLLLAETYFVNMLGKTATAFYCLRLFLRSIKWTIKRPNLVIFTLKQIFRL